VSAALGELLGLHPRLGRIVGLDPSGRALVSFPGSQPRPASTLGPVSRAELERAASELRVVVLAFLDGRADAPVLLSLHGPEGVAALEPTREATPKPEVDPEVEAEVELEAEVVDEVEIEVDGERRIIEATRELTLRCGDASITLQSDGTIKIRGRDVTSWARRRQRIRGGSVNIN
jgi:hypothetical protein